MLLISAFILLGLFVGGFSGLLGVGGGVLVVPALVYLFDFSQKTAQGTAVAMLLPPIGIFTAYNYHKIGEINVKAAIFIVLGFMVGSFISSRYIQNIDDVWLSRVFGVFMLAIAVKMILAK